MVVVLDAIHGPKPPRHPEKAHRADQPVARKPAWIRVKAPVSQGYADTHAIVRGNGLHTVCEEASCLAIEDHLPEGGTSVAKRVQFDHLVPVGVGGKVWAEATLDRIEGRRLVFTLSVSEGGGLVAAGKLVRVIVDRDTFLDNVR